RTPEKAIVGDVVRTSGPLWDKLLEPVLLAALNTPPRVASAALTSAVVRGSLARGGAACRPLVAHPTLAAAFVDPALAYLKAKGAEIRTRRLTAFGIDGKQLKSLIFADGSEAVDGAAILAVPAPVAATLLPGLCVPTEFNPIISLHFALPPPPSAPAILGVLGGITEWIFAFPDRLSVTISAANGVVDRDRADLAAAVWAEVAAALDLTAPLPPWQVVKERRATFAATVEQDALRPPAATATRNLFLAGDWTQTGLPSTIEGAIRSGVTAATLAQGKS
ncbi:MAG: hydroxysqualene dehydroxylase, partial [Janthinobacterium lividum]